MADQHIVDGVKKALESAKPRKFRESVELCINLKEVDLANPKNRIDEEIQLPKGRGRPVKVAVFCGGEMAAKIRAIADRVIPTDEIDKISGDKRAARKLANGYHYFIAEAPLMPTIGKKLGKFFAPRGKMPKPIPAGADPTPEINNIRNKVKVRSKDRRTFHATVGTREMKPEDLADNAAAILKRVIDRLERGPSNIHSVFIKTTMGPAIKIM